MSSVARPTAKLDQVVVCRLTDIVAIRSVRGHPVAERISPRQAGARRESCLFRSYPGGLAVIELPAIIQMNIDRYRSLLREPVVRSLDARQRASIERLLAEAIDQLARQAEST